MAEPGWHPDPAGGDALRWFDGQRWTEHVSMAPAPVADSGAEAPSGAPDSRDAPPLAEEEAAAGPQRSPFRKRWAAVLVAVAAMELVAGGVFVATSPDDSATESLSASQEQAAEGGPSVDALSPSTTSSGSAPTSEVPTTEPAVRPVQDASLQAIQLPDEACSDVVEPSVSRQLVDGASVGPDGQSIQVVRSVTGDLDGDGADDGVVVVACHSGGTLVPFGVWSLVASTGSVIEVPFGDGVESSWELDVGAPAIDGGVLTLELGASEEWDPHCCPSIDVVESLRLQGGAFRRESISTLGVAEVHQRLEEAVAARELDTIADLTTPEVRAVLDDLVSNYGELRVDGGAACGGGNDLGEAYCLVSAGGWAGEVTWRREGFRSWRAVGYAHIGGGM